MLIMWLGGVPLWLSDGYGIGVVCLMACRRLVDILIRVMCVMCGMVEFGCVCC